MHSNRPPRSSSLEILEHGAVSFMLMGSIWHPAFPVCCFLMCLLIRRPNLRQLLLILGVFAITLVLAYASVYPMIGNDSRSDWRHKSDAIYDLITVSGAIEQYQKDNGGLPDSTCDVETHLYDCNDEHFINPRSGNRIRYIRNGDSYDLIALRRDDAVGGTGLATDIEWRKFLAGGSRTPPETKLSIREFIFEAGASKQLFSSVLSISCLAAYLCLFPMSFEHRVSRIQLIVSVVGIVAITIVVGLVLIQHHVALSQSSH